MADEKTKKAGHFPQISWARINIFLVFTLAVIFRMMALDRIPGINGDEAFYGRNALALLRGDHFLLHTPTGNYLNPFHTGVLVILQSFMPLSFWVLRLPALLTGLALIPVTFYVVCKLFDREKALLAALLTAVVPINMAYARMGWDPSQTTFVSIIVIYFALREKWLFTVCALMAAYLVHPTNIFLVPVVLTYPVLSFLKRSYRVSPLKAFGFLCLGSIVAGSVVAFIYWQRSFVFNNMPFHVLTRIQSPNLWVLFFLDYVRLFSGTTIFEYISGSGYTPQSWWWDTAFVYFFIIIFFLGFKEFIKADKKKEFGLLLGLLVALVLFYVIAGREAIRPHQERFAMFLVMPTIVMVAVIVGEFAVSLRQKRWVLATVLVLCWGLLISFSLNYFYHMVRTGGTSHYTFWTGVEEPKKASLNIIINDTKGLKADVIVSQWFSFGPIAYLGAAYKNLNIRMFTSSWRLKIRFARATYIVVFPGDEMDRLVHKEYFERVGKSWEVRGFAGRVVQCIYRME
ncbi:MAG: glycosyltransferase family 39 protein [Candidatus Omnitrophica bacterium]|nr:glycosyltransferase family 39 protein [Candidatus Omnitrophota bacterium]